MSSHPPDIQTDNLPSETAAPSISASEDDVTSTITIRRTSTLIVETRTTTIPSLSAYLPPTSVPAVPGPEVTEAPAEEEEVEVTVEVDPPTSTDFASMLGIGQPEVRR